MPKLVSGTKTWNILQIFAPLSKKSLWILLMIEKKKSGSRIRCVLVSLVYFLPHFYFNPFFCPFVANPFCPISLPICHLMRAAYHEYEIVILIKWLFNFSWPYLNTIPIIVDFVLMRLLVIGRAHLHWSPLNFIRSVWSDLRGLSFISYNTLRAYIGLSQAPF